jgi:hypothetical protein
MASPLRALAGRGHAEIADEFVCSRNRGSVLKRLLAPVNVDADTQYLRTGMQFGTWLRRQLQAAEIRAGVAFFTYNTDGLEVLEWFKQRGLFTVIGQIDPARAEYELTRAQAQRWPGWQPSRAVVPEQYWQRMQAEWRVADAVLVNSNWSRDALISQGVPERKLLVAPLAIGLSQYPASASMVPAPTEGSDKAGDAMRLRALFLGELNLRKDIHYLTPGSRATD